MNKIPIVAFRYLSVKDLGKVTAMIEMDDKNEMSVYQERYALISHEDHNYYHTCSMIDFMLTDIEEHGGEEIIKLYHAMCERYGQEFMDRIVFKDELPLHKKIIDVLNFAFEKLYKTEYIRVEVHQFTPDGKILSSLDEVIFGAIDLNFNVFRRETMPNHRYLIIKRKE